VIELLHIIFTMYSGFHGLYDVEHFIQSLRFDVQIVERIPEIHKNGKTKRIKAFQVNVVTCHSVSSVKFCA